jgi:hypothetical protein
MGTKMSELEELRTENERLRTLNRGLAQQVVNGSTRLEEAKRELLAIGWDAAVAAMRYTDGTPVEIAESVNPYREPVL